MDEADEPDEANVVGEVIEREGELSRVQPEFAGLVDDFVRRARAAFPEDLHSLYLYGSIPRGTARTGFSDLDGQILLRRPPTDQDRASVRILEDELGADHPEVAFVGILLDDVAALTDPADHHDGGFHLRVLCTPVWGPDAGELVAPHVPDVALALGVQGDWRGALRQLRSQAAAMEGPGPDAGRAGGDPAEVATLCRSTGRRLARIAFSWVLPRWAAWTSDPAGMLEAVTTHEPTWVEPMRDAVSLGWEGRVDLDLARHLLGGWTDELIERGTELADALVRQTLESVRDEGRGQGPAAVDVSVPDGRLSP